MPDLPKQPPSSLGDLLDFPLAYLEDGYTHDLFNRIPDDLWEDDRHSDESSKEIMPNTKNSFVINKMQSPMETMHNGYASYRPQSNVVPSASYSDVRSYGCPPMLSASPIVTSSSSSLPTPPNSPEEMIRFDGYGVNNLLDDFPELLEVQTRAIGNVDTIRYYLESDNQLPSDYLSNVSPDQFLSDSPDQFLSDCPDQFLSASQFFSASPDPVQQCAPEMPKAMEPTSAIHCSEPNNLLAFGDDCVKEDKMWSWGDCVFNKVRNASGNSDAVVAKPSPVRYLDEEYEHLPESPISEAEAEDVEMNESNEKPYKVEILRPIIDACVKSEHNYCEKKPLLNASIDASSICVPDHCANIKVVKLENSSQPLKTPFRIVYKSALTTAKNNQLPSNITFKPFTKIGLSVGVAPENTPKTNSVEVRKHLLRSLQESMKNKFSRKIMVSNVDKSKSALCNAPPPNNSADPLRLTSSTISPIVPPAVKTRGKPEAYTKRIRDQHSVDTKKEPKQAPKRRKLNGKTEMSIDKRLEHNSLERKRRIGIKELFDELKLLVPKLQGDRKASKVVILNEARTYIDSLSTFDEHLRLRHLLGKLQLASNRR